MKKPYADDKVHKYLHIYNLMQVLRECSLLL